MVSRQSICKTSYAPAYHSDCKKGRPEWNKSETRSFSITLLDALQCTDQLYYSYSQLLLLMMECPITSVSSSHPPVNHPPLQQQQQQPRARNEVKRQHHYWPVLGTLVSVNNNNNNKILVALLFNGMTEHLSPLWHSTATSSSASSSTWRQFTTMPLLLFL